MSGNNKEIPGFYRDPVTGKYYADRPGISSNYILEKLKTERFNKKFTIKPKITNAVRHLNAREIGNIGGMQESREYLKMRLYLKQNIRSSDIAKLTRYFNLTSVDIDYITGSNHSIYGFWKDKQYGMCIVGALKFKEQSPDDSYFHRTPSPVIDMCEGFNDKFIALYGPSDSHSLLVECFDRYSRMSLMFSIPRIDFDFYEEFKRQMFCCTCNKNNFYFAFGSEDVVICLGDYEKNFFKIKGRNHTLSFDDTGNLMVSGGHTGNLNFYDVRMKTVVMNFKVSKSCLIDSSFINSNDVIIAGTDDVLCKVDIRQRDIVAEFLNHKRQDIRKAPFSIANNMLCAAGSDSTVRIWDLSGGLPLYEMKPDCLQNKIKAWLCNVDNKTNLYCFENIDKKEFQVM